MKERKPCIGINQQHYPNIEFDTNEKDIVQVWMNTPKDSNVIQIELESLKNVINILQNELNEVCFIRTKEDINTAVKMYFAGNEIKVIHSLDQNFMEALYEYIRNSDQDHRYWSDEGIKYKTFAKHWMVETNF